MDYYIHHVGQQPEGPLDMIGLLRRVRKGGVTEQTLMSKGLDQPPKPAGQYPELVDLFQQDASAESGMQEGVQSAKKRSFGKQLKLGVEFLSENWWVSVYSAIFIGLWALVWMVFASSLSVIGMTIALFFSFFLFGPYFYGVLRLFRGHPLSVGAILKATLKGGLGLALAAVVFALLMLPFTALITVALSGTGLVIGFPVYLLVMLCIWMGLIFVPPLVMEKQRDFYDALRESAHAVMGRGSENLGLIFALLAMNVILFPVMLLVLPVTIAAIADIYEEDFF